jgi:hypothetical protein
VVSLATSALGAEVSGQMPHPPALGLTLDEREAAVGTEEILALVLAPEAGPTLNRRRARDERLN